MEVLKPGSLSDRIKMFEAKTCAAPVVPMPETRTYDESAGEDTFVPCVEAPKPVSVSQRKAQMEKQIRQNPPPKQFPSKPAIPSKQDTPLPPKNNVGQPPSQQTPVKSPGKLSIPSSIPGQLSLEEMLQKKLAQGARQPPVASSTPNPQPSLPSRPSEPGVSYQESQSGIQLEQQVQSLRQEPVNQPIPEQSQPIQQSIPAKQPPSKPTQPSHQELQPRQPPHQDLQPQQPTHTLTIPPPVPGQLSLEEMLQKKQSRIVTTTHEEYHESTQSTTVNYAAPPQPTIPEPLPTTPQPPPPTEPSRPIITFTDRSLQDSTNECLFTANGVFLALLTKEDVKKVFASDAPLAISGTSDAIVCIYKDQTCFYRYSPESTDYQLLVSASISIHRRRA